MARLWVCPCGFKKNKVTTNSMKARLATGLQVCVYSLPCLLLSVPAPEISAWDAGNVHVLPPDCDGEVRNLWGPHTYVYCCMHAAQCALWG